MKIARRLPPQTAVLSLVVAVLAQVTMPGHWRTAMAVAFTFALVSWVAFLLSVFRNTLSARWVVGAMVALVVIVVGAPPATSLDVNSYALYGRMVSHYGASPYAQIPRDFPGDPWYARTSYFWNDSPSVYGSVFTGLSAAIMAIAGTSFTLGRLGFQGLAAVALLAAVVMLWRRTRRLDVVAFVGCNPLLLTFGVNDAHCDLLVGVFVLAAALSITSRRWVIGGVLLALAVLVKISAVPALAGAAVWLWFRHGRAAAVKHVLAALVTLAVGLALAGGVVALAPLTSASSRHTRFSVWAPLHELLTALMGAGRPTHAPADAPVSLLANLAVAVVGLWLIWRHRRDEHPWVPIAAGLVSYQVLGAYVLSWYVAWSLPVLALAWRSRLAAVAVAFASWVAVAYLSGYLAAVFLIALGAWVLVRRRRQQKILPWLDGEQRILGAS